MQLDSCYPSHPIPGCSPEEAGCYTPAEAAKLFGIVPRATQPRANGASPGALSASPAPRASQEGGPKYLPVGSGFSTAGPVSLASEKSNS